MRLSARLALRLRRSWSLIRSPGPAILSRRLTLRLTLILHRRLTLRPALVLTLGRGLSGALRGHPDCKRRRSVLWTVARRRPEHILESGEALLRGATDASGVLMLRRPGHTRLRLSPRLDRSRVCAHVEEACPLPARGSKLGRWRRHAVTERGSRALGNDAVFALAVRHVVRGRHAALGSEHWVTALCFVGHDARHRCGVAVDTRRFRGAPGSMTVIRVTAAAAEAAPQAGENARVALVLAVVGRRPNRLCQLALMGLDS